MDYSKKTKQYWRKQIKRRGVLALGNKCAICGGEFEDCCYDFHHINPLEKNFAISSGNTNGARDWLRIRDELKKCVLLCSNCHRLVHNNFIELDINALPSFLEEYYEWDWCNEKAINTLTSTLIKKDENLCVCPTCGKTKSAHAKECLACSKAQARHYEVSREELKHLIYTIPMTQIGKMFGVSDNAIRKRCVSYSLPSKKSEIKQYSKEEWDRL